MSPNMRERERFKSLYNTSEKKDRWGVWALRLLRKREKVTSFYSTLFTRICAVYWGVSLGDSCRFFGVPVFRRAPNSTILIGDNCTFRSSKGSNLIGINRPCMLSTLRPGGLIHVGKKCGLSGTVIGAAECIQLGNNVLCGANVTITDTDWHRVEPEARRGYGNSAPVLIEDNVWLGINVIVLKGVKIGENSVIGAGSVVTKSIPSNVIAVGQPVRIIKSL
jgi:acetyltransferase-like isoleucine patch superfamily enzyme